MAFGVKPPVCAGLLKNAGNEKSGLRLLLKIESSFAVIFPILKNRVN
jgi:hypothetical protein